MSSNNRQPMFDPLDDLRTDHVLIAAGVGATLFALLYLLLM
jgi:hypothetical protein